MNRTTAIDERVTTSVLPSGETEVIGEIMLLETRYMVVALPEGAHDLGQAGPVHGCPAEHDGVVRFEVAGRLCSLVARQGPATGAQRCCEPADLLTKRELQIAELVASGRINKQIASDLNISEWTVSTHLRRIYSKLGIRTRAALAYRCAFLLTGTEHGETRGRWQ